MKRILLLAQDSDLTRVFYNRLSRDIEIDAILLENRVSTAVILRRRLRRLGPRTVAGQLAFQLLVQRPLAWLSRERIRRILNEAGAAPRPLPAAKAEHVRSFNSDEGRAAIAAARPDIVLVHGTRILSPRTIDAAGAPLINVHAGVTPFYRGVHGGYWALAARDRARCGVTVHRIDAGIDTGEALAQAAVRPTCRDNFATYPYLQVLAGADLVSQVLQGRYPSLPAASSRGSRLFYHPTLRQYLTNGITQGVW